MGGEPAPSWQFDINSIPELPFETTFNPGSFTVAQGTGGAVPGGSAVGSTVSGSQVSPGSISGQQIAQTLSARTVGGIASFVAAATPYDWSFAVTGTPADSSYFSCTPIQAQPIAPGDTFSSTAGLGSPFTVTSVEQVSATVTNVHFTPDATSVMSTGTVQGGKNGDTWVNTSAGNQVNQWVNGSWSAITWNAANVIAAASITATQIAANTITASQIAAGIVIAGVVDGTVITGALIQTASSNPAVQMDGARDAIFGYDASSNLLFALAGASGTDFFSHAYPQGLFSQQITLNNQSSAPASVSGATVLYSSTAGRLRMVKSSGADDVIERGSVNVAVFSVGNTTTVGPVSATMNYKAADAAQSSTYEIEIAGTLQLGTTAETITFKLYVDGVNIGGAGGGFVIGAAPLNITGGGWSYRITFTLSVLTTGTSGVALVSSHGAFADNSGTNLQTSTMLSPAGGGGSAGAAFDTTIDHTLNIQAFWGGAGGSAQKVQTTMTRMTRYM
jgi:hypothetical protein